MITLLIRNSTEAIPLRDLALRTAKGLEQELTILALCDEGCKEINEVDENSPKWVQSLMVEGVTTVYACGGKEKYAKAERFLLEQNGKLTILGKHLNTKTENEDTKFSRHLYQVLPTQVLLIRLGEQEDAPETEEKHAPLSDEKDTNPVLVACGNGSHTRRALRIAHAIAGEDLVAFHISPDVDPESSFFAKQSLNKIIDKAGFDPSLITRKTVLTSDLPKALRAEVVSGHEGQSYSMLILGESQNRGLKEKLFGTVPEKLVNKSDGLTIGVMRAEQPVGHRVRDTCGKLIRVKVPQLKREERIALFSEIESKSRWTFDFAALMTLAALVAGLGLLANSGAVVIGAMLLAPLMMPLIGSGLALSQGNTPLFKRSLSAVVRGFLAALLTGISIGLVGRYFQIPLTEELAARGNPTLLDLGVAFVSGIAAAYCIARPNLSGALAGVAIAAALVPPIVTVGICLTMGELSVSKGAGLLFGTNVVAVIFGSALNFTLAGIKGQGEAGEVGRRFMFVLALACVGLAIPLTSVLVKKIPKIEEIIEETAPLAEFEERVSSVLPEGVTLAKLEKEDSEGTVNYKITVESTEGISQEEYQAIKNVLQRSNKEVKVKVETRLVRGEN